MVVIAQGAALVGQFAMHLLAVRILGDVSYGQLVVILAAGNILAIPVGLGLKSSAIAHIPGFIAANDSVGRSQYLRSTFRMVGIAGLSSIILGLTFALLGFFDGGSEAALKVVLTCGFGTALALMTLANESSKADDHPLSSLIASGMVAPMATFTGLMAVWVFDLGWAAAVCAFMLGSLVASAVQYWHLQPGSGQRAPRSLRNRWLRHGLPLAFGGFGQRVISQAPVLIVAAEVSNQAAAGFSAATRLGTFISMLGGAISASLTPGIAVLRRSGEADAAKARFKRLLRIVWTITLPFATVTILLEDHLLRLFGESFVDYTQPGRILVVGFAISALCGPVAAILIGTDKPGHVTLSFSILAFLLVLVAIPITRAFGPTGAAVAVAATISIQNIWQAAVLYRSWPRQSAEGPSSRIVP